MIHEKIYLTEDKKAVLKAYVLDDGELSRKGLKRPAVIVCPGGGYTYVSKDEGEPVALFFNRHGFHAFVLEYSVKIENPFPKALQELAKAMNIVRNKNEEWLIADDITVIGFSAGGNLALSLGIYYGEHMLTTELGLTKEITCPNRIVLGYPAVTLEPKSKEISSELIELMEKGLMPDFRGPNIREILIGHEGIADNEAEQLNLLNHLHKEMPPVFAWGSFEDSVIPATDLTGLAARLYELSVPCELHLFNFGPHGTSLCDGTVRKEEEIAGLNMGRWTELCLGWMRYQM